MTTRMLIDVRQPEETRVAVIKNGRIEEFDFEASSRKQIKGNIYLAKVTRVEPSLQAAFIDYGGNRHGFLAFSEIHPDYYQIPKEDRDQLLLEEQEIAREHSARVEEEAGSRKNDDEDDAEEVATAGADGEDGSDDVPTEDLRRRRIALRKRYKIQEVIRRRQVMLVQVVKEERGNKGAALTTYLSLAGRYSVLMPNTAHGGGISRKISNAADRKRLKAIMTEINLPDSMGAIIRTAGVQRTKTEIRRDFTYLTRLWDRIREKTLASTAPALIHEDSALVKRAIRDIYTRDIDEILVDGEEGYQQARTFMKLLTPSHVRKVRPYADEVPLFQRAGIEAQLAALVDPVVRLKSGGYLVINPTEALVSVDVNSGKANREHSIEDTALKTNIEAANEVARQLRLRDLAGLVVIDFIDMEHHSNNRRVERALKEALKLDRARIQVGRISSFGLLEMSRQRLRTGLLEATTEVCPTCAGSGVVRADSSAALHALRALEDEIVKGRASRFTLRTSTETAFYILNRKRAELHALEGRYGIHIDIVADPAMPGGGIAIDSSGPAPRTASGFGEMTGLPALAPANRPKKDSKDEEEDEEEEDEKPRSARKPARSGAAEKDSGDDAGQDSPDEDNDETTGNGSTENGSAENGGRKSRRRRPRRRRSDSPRETGSGDHKATADNGDHRNEDGHGESPDEPATPAGEAAREQDASGEQEASEKPKRRPRSRRRVKPATEATAEAETVAETADSRSETRKADDGGNDGADDRTDTRPANDKAANDEAPAGNAPETTSGDEEPQAEPRRGWWQRTFGG